MMCSFGRGSACYVTQIGVDDSCEPARTQRIVSDTIATPKMGDGSTIGRVISLGSCPRMGVSANCLVRELAVSELVCPRIVQIPFFDLFSFCAKQWCAHNPVKRRKRHLAKAKNRLPVLVCLREQSTGARTVDTATNLT